jgi:hypothetical protein
MKNIVEIYCNGCSHSAGGGMEIDRTISDESITIREYYKNKYNVWWDTQIEVTYSHRLAEIFNCKVVNESISGGGSGRLVRMTYNYIRNNWNIKDKLFLILEMPSLGRLDLYSTKLEDYIIFNLQFNNNDYYDNSISSLHGTRRYYDSECGSDNEQISFSLNQYYKSFFDKKVEYKKISRELNTLYTFLKYHKIKFIFFNGEFGGSIDTDIKQSNMLNMKVGNQIIEDFHQYAIDTKTTLADETNREYMDLHPGYFSHLNFAKELSQYIKVNYEKF